MASYGNEGKRKSPKTYLDKKKFLDEKDRGDKTVVTSLVRQYEFGGATAEFTLDVSGNSFNNGWTLGCNPYDKESKQRCIAKADYLIECLQEFKKAVREAAADEG